MNFPETYFIKFSNFYEMERAGFFPAWHNLCASEQGQFLHKKLKSDGVYFNLSVRDSSVQWPIIFEKEEDYKKFLLKYS